MRNEAFLAKHTQAQTIFIIPDPGFSLWKLMAYPSAVIP